MDYVDFFEYYVFLKKSVALLEQGVQEMEKKSPLRKMFKKEIGFQKGMMKTMMKHFAKSFPSTLRAFVRLGEEKENFLLKKLIKNHELCTLVAEKIVDVFFYKYKEASLEQKQLWIKLVSTKEVCTYLFNHANENTRIKYVAEELKNNMDKGEIFAMHEVLQAILDELPAGEENDEQRALMRTFAID